MAERLTKSAARNIFYGGSAFFFAIFVGLTAHSHYYMLTTSTDEATLTDGGRARQARLGEELLHQLPHAAGRGRLFRARTRQCLGPLGRPGGPGRRPGDPESLDASAAERHAGRRQMPQFNLTDQELNDLADFLEWTSSIKTPELAAEQGRLSTLRLTAPSRQRAHE